MSENYDVPFTEPISQMDFLLNIPYIEDINDVTYENNTDLQRINGATCPICLKLWTNSGFHRLVSLKCGHLFGSSCIVRKLQMQPCEERSCPICKGKANLGDLRLIYAERLIKENETEIALLKMKYEELKTKNVELKTKLSFQKEQMELLMNKSEPRARSWRFSLEETLEICKDGDAYRVMAYNCRTNGLFISKKTNNKFPRYGIVKASLVDYKFAGFHYLHQKEIRDLAYSQPQNLLLTASLDKTAKIINQDMISVSKIKTEKPIWSCTWDHNRPNYFYLGCVGGSVFHYDVRNISRVLEVISAPDISPVISVQSTLNGLVACHENSCLIWTEFHPGQWRYHHVPVEGPYSSLSCDRESKRMLISSRATVNERSKLSVVKIHDDRQNIKCELEQTFQGSLKTSFLSRTTWVEASGDKWAAAYSESASMLCLNGINGVNTVTLMATDPVLDLCSVELNGTTILASLSKTNLGLYKVLTTT